MSGEDVSKIVELFFIAWMVVLFGFVIIKLLRGEVNTVGLLSTPQNSNEPQKLSEQIDPERLLLVISTIIAAVYYIMLTMQTTCAQGATDCWLPDIPNELLMLLGGSHSAFLTGKIYRRS